MSINLKQYFEAVAQLQRAGFVCDTTVTGDDTLDLDECRTDTGDIRTAHFHFDAHAALADCVALYLSGKVTVAVAVQARRTVRISRIGPKWEIG